MALSGKSGAVTISAAEILGMSAWSISQNVATEGSTDFQDDGVTTNIPTISSFSGSFSGHKDAAPLAIVGLGSVAATFKESETVGQVWSGNIIIQAIDSDLSYDGVVTYSYTFVGDGALTIPTA